MAEDAGWTRLSPGAPLTLWAMAAPEETLYSGQVRPMPDHVDYRFRNGWTATGDLPCREALREVLPSREVPRPKGPFDAVHLGLDGADLDFSVFRHRPTLIVHAFRCRLKVEAEGQARLAVETCGGVRLWLGETPVAVFEPFTRNRRQRAKVDVALPQGEHDLTLRLEDLHERDTACLARLTWLDGPPAAVGLPAGLTAGDPGEISRTLSGLATDAVFYEGGEIRLSCDPPPARAFAVAVAPLVPFPRGGLSSDPVRGSPTVFTLAPDRPVVAVARSDDVAPGCLSVDMEVEIDGARVRRRLGTTNMPPGEPLAGDLTDRKTRAAELIAARGGFEPSVAALLAIRGERPGRVAEIVSAALDTVETREDCSDFTMLPLLRLWRDAAGALDPALRARLRAGILGWRYWLDEPGDDVMWFWSENHVLCFHAAQLVAGTLFPDETFPNSGKTGAQLRREADGRLHRWFDSIDAHGLCEWNSAAYYPIDLIGLLTLHGMAPALRDRAARVMDRIFVMTGLHTTGGVPAGSQGRCYEKELLAGPATELGSVAAIAFGGEWRPGYDRAAALLCLSDYVPPAVAGRLAAPRPEETVEARYTQGLDHAGRLTLWKSAEAQLSTSTGHEAGAEGHQAQVLDVQMAAHPMARLWVNHPGELKPWGERRPSLLAGNHVMPRVAQRGPTALLVYDLDRPWTDLAVTQLFAMAGAFDGYEAVAGWHVFRAGTGRAAVWCSRPLAGVQGLYRGALRRAEGLRTAWVVALSMPGEDDAAFRTRLGAPRFDESSLALEAAGHDGTPLSLVHDGPFLVGGAEESFAPLSPEPHFARNEGPLRVWTEQV